MYFLKKKLPYLLTVAFGTDTIAETRVPKITLNIGRKNGNAILNTIKK